MGKNLIGNNCGLLYEDKQGNLLLISVSPAILNQQDVIEVYHEESWVYGRIEYDESKYEGYYLFNTKVTKKPFLQVIALFVLLFLCTIA